MHTFHIHINGLVQGVGFRPYVYQLATSLNLNGWVNNGMDGIHIEINASAENANSFLQALIQNAPSNAIITTTHIQETTTKQFTVFEIHTSDPTREADLLIAPDFSICTECKNEIQDATNKRYKYAFTTCLACGPRYSIIEKLPYDRAHTTMKKIEMCPSCEKEYNDVLDRRHYSQTNSCRNCTIPMYLFESPNSCVSHDNKTIITSVVNAIKNGETIAIKNTGGYLLLCDATNKVAIETLRKNKKRPTKPFAVLFSSVAAAKKAVVITEQEAHALESIVAPIVLCKIKDESATSVQKESIAPALDKLGIILPSSALLYIISLEVKGPMIATSANISGAPIIYKDVDALENLFQVASLVLTYDRDIVSPQDDTVIQFTSEGQKIILRRSRGLAPNYFPNPFSDNKEIILATGGELKSAFAYANLNQLYISQFLGDQSHLASQEAYGQTFKQFQKLFKKIPEKVLIDMHPNYFVGDAGKQIAGNTNAALHTIQHHKAHFASVLSENGLLGENHIILGFIWDGTGYGEDGQIWGSELFMYKEALFTRLAHLEYFPILLGDKMSKEPRLSALSLLKSINKEQLVKKHFTTQEWQYYSQLIEQPAGIQTCSMGRFLDGLACIMGINSKTSFEGEAVMKLEAIARTSYAHKAYYSFKIIDHKIHWNGFIQELLLDLDMHKEKDFIARKIVNGLVQLVLALSNQHGVYQLAFSGGVFQNALLVDTLIENIGDKRVLYFQKQVSPNDEGIALGQMAYHLNEIHFSKLKEEEEINNF